jgi:transcriptional regulator with XRE-family HTH domain
MTVGERVCLLRFNAGLGPAALAKAAGVSRTGLYRIEHGQTARPRARVLAAIAAALGVTAAELLGLGDVARFDSEAEAAAFLRIFGPSGLMPPGSH